MIALSVVLHKLIVIVFYVQSCTEYFAVWRLHVFWYGFLLIKRFDDYQRNST